MEEDSIEEIACDDSSCNSIRNYRHHAYLLFLRGCHSADCKKLNVKSSHM